MSRFNGRMIDDEFLNSYVQYEDEDYVNELKKFHWSLFHLYGIDQNNTIKEKNEAEGRRRLLRQSLQDETTRRLYRFMDEAVRVAGGELDIFKGLLGPDFTEHYDILTREDVKNMFTRRFSWPWRDMDIWIKFPKENEDDDKNEVDFGWYDKNTEEPYVSIKMTDWIGDHEDEFHFDIPLKYLMMSTINHLGCDGEFQHALQVADIEHKYNVLFKYHDVDSKKKILDIIDEAGLTEKIKGIKEAELAEEKEDD